MKRNHCRLPYLFMLAAILAFAACSKDGAQGPAGPAGAAGGNGTNGTNGAKGDKGDTGVANIIYSAWVDVNFAPVKDSVTGDTVAFRGSIPAPKLTADILSKGLVYVYLNLDVATDPFIVPIPYVEPGVYINFAAFVGTIGLTSNQDLGTGLNGDNVKVYQYRYVLVPGGVTARSSSAVNWKDYKSVQKYLGLKD